jgi:hypothetical protein
VKKSGEGGNIVGARPLHVIDDYFFLGGGEVAVVGCDG